MSLRICFRGFNKYANIHKQINILQQRTFTNNLINFNKIYTETHEWLLIDKDTNKIKLGLSKEAINQMDEIVYIDVESIEFDNIYNKEDLLCEIESTKAVESINCPYNNCKVSDINIDIIEELDSFNHYPEDDNSWILELETDKSNLE
jgi:glycine cleavage system H lipoate-binding protein